jgi:ribosome maturation factor RimP
MRKRAIARFCVFKRDKHGKVKRKKQDLKTGSRAETRRHPPVNEQKIVEQVKVLAEPLCEAEGLDLIYVEFQREAGGRILRLYIDKPGGVSLNDCVGISRQMGDIIDVNVDDIGPFNLEVSSPGPARPLATAEDFEKFKGNRVKIRTNRPIDGQKNFKGILLGISDGQIRLQLHEQILSIPNQDILKARLAD